MEKRVTWQRPLLPWLLLAPQLAITLLFFIWPASQALYQSVLQQDPFGLATEFVGLENFIELFHNPQYFSSFRITLVFSLAVAFSSLSIALLLAVMAHRIIVGDRNLENGMVEYKAGRSKDAELIPVDEVVERFA